MTHSILECFDTKIPHRAYLSSRDYVLAASEKWSHNEYEVLGDKWKELWDSIEKSTIGLDDDQPFSLPNLKIDFNLGRISYEENIEQRPEVREENLNETISLYLNEPKFHSPYLTSYLLKLTFYCGISKTLLHKELNKKSNATLFLKQYIGSFFSITASFFLFGIQFPSGAGALFSIGLILLSAGSCNLLNLKMNMDKKLKTSHWVYLTQDALQYNHSKTACECMSKSMNHGVLFPAAFTSLKHIV